MAGGRMTDIGAENPRESGESDLVPFHCEACQSELVYICDDLEAPCYLQHCTYEAIEVWCIKCKSGYTFALEDGSRPSAWECPECGAYYTLPMEIYSNPVPLLDPSFIVKYRENYKPKDGG